MFMLAFKLKLCCIRAIKMASRLSQLVTFCCNNFEISTAPQEVKLGEPAYSQVLGQN